MKKIIAAAAFLMGAFMISCQEDVNIGALNNYPPAVFKTTPDGNTKVGVAFPLKVILVDGPSSPLASATVTLTDSLGKSIYTTTKALSGTMDSIVVAGTDFGSTSLKIGLYKIVINAVDKGGNTTDKTITFKVSENLYAAKNKEMYLAGPYNNWGADAFTLVGPYTWQIKNVDLKSGAFKFKNTPDWKDADWGDPTCSGLMLLKGADSGCKYSGPVNISFNDQTLRYTVTPAVNYVRNITNLYLLGSMNNFEGTNYNFTLKADHIWELPEVRLSPGSQFRFSVGQFGGDSFGESGTAGTALAQGPNIVEGSTFADAFYKITFNDKTLAYTLTLVRYPYPDTIFLVGGATAGGWEAGNAVPFVKLEAGKFEIYVHLKADGFKFLPTKGTFDGDWGSLGDNSGKLVQTDEKNVTVADEGEYRIYLDFTNNTYSVTKLDWGIIGSATPGGWDGDTDMTYVSDYKWAIDVALVAGEFKFRSNDKWDINFGSGGTNKLSFNSSNNMPSPGTGLYHVVMDLDPVAGYTWTATPK